MKKKKTTEQFKNEVYEKVKDEYAVLGEYLGSSIKIEMKHNICGHIYDVRPNSFLNQANRCPKCSNYKNTKKTTEEFKQEVYEKVKDEYSVLGEYIKAIIPIEMKHNPCGHIYFVKPNDFLKGARCSKCSNYKNTKKTTEQFKNEVYKLVDDEYTVLGEYVNNSTKIEIKHNICGYIYKVKPSNFVNMGSRCPKCTKKGCKNKLKQF